MKPNIQRLWNFLQKRTTQETNKNTDDTPCKRDISLPSGRKLSDKKIPVAIAMVNRNMG
ncbi:hypothetical protein [uncultured Bacteroides sp.]|uniref:hypothetical protein n=1 Tax=uncultured Bacteroides sp. TaxID=162156 RepID=UPI00280A7FB7|nr:hypothetical protein [uncultured Bacteroides sp.]